MFVRALTVVALCLFIARPASAQAIFIGPFIPSDQPEADAANPAAGNQAGNQVTILPLGNIGGGMFGGSPTFRMPTDPLSLLQSKQFGEDITLLDYQEKQLETLAADVKKKQIETILNMREAKVAANSPEFHDRTKSMQAEIKKLVETRLEKILLPAQRERLDEIRAQVELRQGGFVGGKQSRLAELIKLTDKQRQQLVARQGEFKARLQKEIAAVKARLEKEFLGEVLSKKQLAKLESLTGDRVNLNPNAYREQLQSRLREQFKAKLPESAPRITPAVDGKTDKK